MFLVFCVQTFKVEINFKALRNPKWHRSSIPTRNAIQLDKCQRILFTFCYRKSNRAEPFDAGCSRSAQHGTSGTLR